MLLPLFFASSCEEDVCEEDVVHGCLDSQACNYNSKATIDNNGSPDWNIYYVCQ